MKAFGFEAHYGFGNWIECPPGTATGGFGPDCLASGVHSSPGKFGFYPWVDRSNGYYGILGAYQTVPLASALSYAAGQSLQPLIAAALEAQGGGSAGAPTPAGGGTGTPTPAGGGGDDPDVSSAAGVNMPGVPTSRRIFSFFFLWGCKVIILV